MVAKRDILISRARELYAAGLSQRQVAEVLGVHRTTVRTWARQERDQGQAWEKLREERRRTRPSLILRELKRRFADALLRQPAEDETPKDVEDRLLKLTRIIEGYGKLGGVADRLEVMEEFAAFCAGTLGKEERTVVRRAVTGYLQQVKAGAAG